MSRGTNLSTITTRAPKRVLGVRTHDVRLEPLCLSLPIVEDLPERRLAILRRDRGELHVHGRRGPVRARDPDAEPPRLRRDEAEVAAVVRPAPAVGIEAAALRAQAVRLRELDEPPFLQVRRAAVVEVDGRNGPCEVDARP